MKKLIATVALCLTATATFAGPKSFSPGESGTTEDGRAFEKKFVNCSGKSEPREVTYFEDTRKWCLNDESYCSRDMIRAAKKSCKK